MDEEFVVVDQSGDQSDSEPAETVQEVEVIDYTPQLDQLHADQQVIAGLSCVIVGLLLVSIILGTLRRFL